MISVGQTIGNYRITAKLGEGGMGVVYLAEHPVIGKKVAMKAIHPELSRNADVISRFVTEAQAVNQIGHDNIVDIADFGNTPDGEFYFVMELLQGEPLSERLKREGALPAPRAFAIAMQIADALAASHEHGIVHRDLKPENVFLLHRGGTHDFVKVLDFGLAKLTVGEGRVTHKTRTGYLMGTPYYMSPEQCEGKAEIDHRSDIYALGVLLFEMLTGKVPFGGEGYGEIIVKHITMPPPSVRSIVADLHRAFDAVLYRALAKDRDQRFQTMRELRDALAAPEAYAAGAPTAVMPEDSSGIARAAKPMTRSEIDIHFGRTRMIEGGQVSIGTPSTFRQSVGEILEELTPRKKTSKLLISAALIANTAAILASFVPRREAARPPELAAAAPAPPAKPTNVRVNFNSDPVGATVLTAAGELLGRTPLSLELPYSDAPADFVFQKTGFERKTMSIVPNLPAPLFATLQPVPAPPVEAAAPPPAPKKPSKRPKPVRQQRLDDDAVLAPTFE
jgi:tRNA A-37 threonylcarbamoyl transferase component Bud32